MRLRRQSAVRLSSILMLVVIVNNAVAIDHLLPFWHHDEEAAAHAVSFVMPPTSDVPEAKADKPHTHRKVLSTTPLSVRSQAKAIDVQQPTSDQHDDSHGEAHVQHCHISPGTCAEQPIPTGPGQMLFAEPLLAAIDLQLIAAEDATLTLTTLSIDPLTPPPQL